MSGEPRRKAERKREGGRVRMGDRDRLQHLTACPGEPLKVTEREKHRWAKREARQRERDVHCSRRVITK